MYFVCKLHLQTFFTIYQALSLSYSDTLHVAVQPQINTILANFCVIFFNAYKLIFVEAIYCVLNYV